MTAVGCMLCRRPLARLLCALLPALAWGLPHARASASDAPAAGTPASSGGPRGAAAQGAPAVWLRGPLVVPALRGQVKVPAAGDVAIDLLRNAQTLVPLSPLLPSTLTAKDTRWVNAAIQRWRAGGRRKVYGALELLRWAEPGVDYRRDPLGRRPDWRALNENGRCEGPGSDGVYASPYHPEVRRLLAGVARRAGTDLPALDGIVIFATLSSAQRLDLSEPARAACVRACSFDPADLLWESAGPADQALNLRWAALQRQTVGSLVGEVASSYRRARPGAKVAAMAWAPYYFEGEVARGRVANDWLAWAAGGWADELWLFCSRFQSLRGKPFAGTLARAAKFARYSGRWPLRGVAFASASGSAAGLQAEMSQARLESGGAPVVVIADRRELEWLTPGSEAAPAAGGTLPPASLGRRPRQALPQHQATTLKGTIPGRP